MKYVYASILVALPSVAFGQDATAKATNEVAPSTPVAAPNAALEPAPPAAPVGEAAAVAPVLPPAGEAPPPEPVVQTPPPPATPGIGTGGFMDTRLTWTLGDDDLLHDTGQVFPLSQALSIGDRKQYRLFFDNLNSRFGGRENLSHLVLYKKMPAFIDNLETEASLVLRLDIAALSANDNNVNKAFYDAGSFIRLYYELQEKRGVSLTLWPIDTDRFRLGYLYDLSWGGTNAGINQSIFPRIQGASPGAKLQFEHEKFQVFAGFKTASIVQVEQSLSPGTREVEEIRVGQANYGFLAGGGVDAHKMVRIDAGTGYFQQGKFDLPDVAGESIYTLGGSARVVVHHPDQKVGQSADFLLYRNDPDKPLKLFAPESYTAGKTTWSGSLEFNHLWQKVKDFDQTGETLLQPARSGALQGTVKSGFFRASVTGIYRDLPYVLRNQPSFIPFQSIPNEATTTDELFFAAAVDYHFEGTRLTPGIGGGLQLPATFQTSSRDAASSPINRTVVVREQGNIAILPVNQDAVPIIQARVSLKWDVSDILSAVVWGQYIRDNNLTFVERDPAEGTVALRTFLSPDFFGFGTSVQARF